MILIQPSIVAVVSIFFGTPLHIISTGDSPHVTAALSLGKLIINIATTDVDLL